MSPDFGGNQVIAVYPDAIPFIVIGLLLLIGLLWMQFGMKANKEKKEKNKFNILKIAVLLLAIIMFLIAYFFYTQITYTQ